MAEELAAHVELRTRDLVRSGLAPEEARRRASLDFGSRERYKDEVREVRLGLWAEQLRQDLRYATRSLARRPGFTAAAILTLALGIGATATVFSLLDEVLLRPLPVQAPDELVHVYTSCRRGNPYCASSYPEYLDYRTRNRTLAGLAAFTPVEVSVDGGADGWVASGLLVSTSYFSVLGVAPHVGQLIAPGWDVTADPPLVLDHGVWLTRYGGDPHVVGRTLRLGGNPFRIVGVAPPGFHGTRLDEHPDLWIAIDNVSLTPAGAGRDLLASRAARWIGGTVGRLAPGVTIAQAQADLDRISEGLQDSDPTRDGRFVTVEAASRAALPPAAAGDITRFVALLMAGVSATLLIACANIAGLLLARGAARRRELELRRALGADRNRLVRQLLTEYVPLALAGTLGGLLVARWAMALLATYDLPGAVPVSSLGLGLDARVLAFSAVLFVATALFGLVPALGTTRRLAALATARTTGEGTGRARGQGTLLVAQVAVAVVLLFGAGLFIRSLQHGLALDLGLTGRSVVMARITPTLEGYAPSRTRAVLDEATSGLASLPNVEVASAAVLPPLGRGNGFLAEDIEGYVPGPGEEMRFESNFVLPGYFAALGIDVLAGRSFTGADRAGTPLVAVISERMARRYWAGRDPIGGHFRSRSFPEPVEIVGVVRNVAVGLDGTAEPFVYLALRQHPRFLAAPIPMMLFARASSNPSALVASLRGVLHGMDASLPVSEVTTLEARIAELLMPQRLASALLSVLAGLTLILVGVGVVGMVSYGVSRRRREIGVRLALGAARARVTATMIHGVLVPVAVGLAVGAAGAFSLGRIAVGFLYDVAPADPATFAVTMAALALIAGVASFVPAWRATRISPREVLNAD